MLADAILIVLADELQDEETNMKRDEPPNPSNVVNVDAARDALGGDEDLLRIVTTAFLEESPKLVRDMQNAFKAGDANGLRLAAHALKGAIRYYGDTTAYRLAYDIEVAATHENLDELEEVVVKIDGEIELMQRALQPIVSDGTP